MIIINYFIWSDTTCQIPVQYIITIIIAYDRVQDINDL